MQGFFQFNNSIINEILNFATSACDVLFVSGPTGSGKSETVAKAVPELSETNLIFQHFCFENSVIDDFLLNFYDSFKKFSDSNKISLKKFSAESFEEKIKHYFKAVDKNCIIIAENFEKVSLNTQIVDFLTYLTNYNNVKIITISKDNFPNPFKIRKAITQELEIEQISKKDFKSKFAILAETTDDTVKERFYDITGGLELYLNMGVKYCNITGAYPNDLINEYERKSTIYSGFEEFIVSKFYSLIPANYLKCFKMLCLFNHPISMDFLQSYEFGNLNCINYLAKNLLVSSFIDEIYVKDYFKQYVLKNFSIQEKISLYKEVVKIYETELIKSPKERQIRLSREAIRKEIERTKMLIPSITNKEENKNTFAYIGINNLWHDEKLRNKTKLSEKLNKIKERRNFLSKEKTLTFIPPKPSEEPENKGLGENERRSVINLINNARDYCAKYEYRKAIGELNKAKEIDTVFEFAIEILMLCAKCYENLSEFDNAQKYYTKAFNHALENNDSRKVEIKFQMAFCNKNLYKFEEAKKQFFEIASNENYQENYRTKALIEIGEIEQAGSNSDEAVKCYTTALSISLGKNKELTCKAYYRLAVLYDERQDTENALKYYRKNYITSSEHSENKYYSVSLTNSAIILYEQGNIKEAIEDLKLALQFDSELNDYENMYFAQKELARIYSNIDEISSIGYFKQALTCAQNLKDDFKIANVYFEAGNYYYDRGNDKKALISFFSAKYALKNKSDSENLSKINSRIKDIKVRLDDDTFNSIAEKYDK